MIPNKAKTFEGEIQAFSERCLSSPLEMGAPGEVFWACPIRRPRTQWGDYGWECLGVSQGKLEEVAREREVWACPQDSAPDKQNKMNQWNYL